MADTFDAFTQGVALGGLRMKSSIRVLLCYILKNIKSEISKTAINEILQITELVNFFEVNDGLSNLAENGLVTVSEHDGDEYYTLTDEGARVADRLDSDLPISVREKAVAAALRIASRERMRGYTDYSITALQKGYHVACTIKDGDTEMLRVVLYAADTIQANAIGERFMENPGSLYGAVVDSLTS